MAFVTYYANVYPKDIGGMGPFDTVALTVTVTGGSTSSTPCLAQADIAAFNAASANDQERHRRYSDIVSFFSQYGQPVSNASDGDNLITLKYESKGMFVNSTLGKPGWFAYGHRPNAYDLCATYVANDSFNVSAMTVTINGSAQSGT